MRKLVGADSFILIAKALKGINLITDTPVKHPIALAIGLPRLMLGESLVLTLYP